MTVHAFHFSSSLGSLPTFAVLHTKPTSNRGASGGNADKAPIRCNSSNGCFNAEGTRQLTRFSLGGFQVRSNAASAGDNRR